MPDKQLKCADCASPFVFSERDQEFHKKMGFTNEPKRCPPCRQIKKQRLAEKEKQDQQRS